MWLPYSYGGRHAGRQADNTYMDSPPLPEVMLSLGVS